MTTSTQPSWRLDELVRRSRRLLALLPGGEGGSRRVRWQPDERLVRYYTTLGLLDRPAELRGRTAYYRDRHLLQLLAIKTLQAGGQSLRAAQARLAGQSDAALAALIGLPPDWAERLDGGEPAAESGRAPAAVAETPPATPVERFWAVLPATPSPALTPAAERLTGPSTGLEWPFTELLAVKLAPGARLLVDRRRYPELDAGRLREAAALLRACLGPAHALEDNDNDDA